MVLVTGASGFLGRHLVRYLSGQGIPVRALYLSHPPGAELATLPCIEWRHCDLLDIYDVEAAMSGITDVYHCAAIVSFDVRQRESMLHFNPESTAHIVNEALRQGIRKMVYASSVAAIGRMGGEKEITEEQEWGESRYNSAYGVSKHIAEMEVWRAIGEGLNAVIVNPGIIIGEAASLNPVTSLMKMTYREFPFFTTGINSWVDVADVVRLMVMLMNSDVHTERFIISGGNYSYHDILAMMAKALGKKPPRLKAGRLMTGIAWRLSMMGAALTGKPSLITRETAQTANAVCIYRNEKLLKIFPDFSYTPVHQPIEAMARYFMNSHKK